MFWKMFKMELSRALRFSTIIAVTMMILLLMIFSDFQLLQFIGMGEGSNLGIINQLESLLGFDTYKCVMAVLLASIYTGSFAKDDNSHYLRMILNRMDVTVYTQCRFLANLCVIVVTSVLSFYLYTAVMSWWMPLHSEEVLIDSNYYYGEIRNHFSILYVGFMGLIFGLVAAASSSVGILFSVYKPNTFVSIAASGLVLFLGLSYIPFESPMNLLNLLSMYSTIGQNTPWQMMFLWILVYMLSVIAICGFLFWKRMKWRLKNGYI